MKKIYLIFLLINSLTNSLPASTNNKRSREIATTTQAYLKKQKSNFDQDIKDLEQIRNKLIFLEKALKNHELLKNSDYFGLYFNEIYDRSEDEFVITGEKTPQEKDAAIKKLIE